MKDADLVSVPLGSVSRELILEASKRVSNFSTALVLNGRLAGSGTFVRFNNDCFILTAHHVVHNPHDRNMVFDFSSSNGLGLLLAEYSHFFEIPLNYCECIDVGIPQEPEYGPDLSLIRLPQTAVGTIQARKEFYNLSHDTDVRCSESLKDHGLFFFAGFPKLMSNEIVGSHGFEKSLFLGGLNAGTLVKGRFTRGEFDYLELGVSYLLPSKPIRDFSGMSGGGIWRVALFKRESEDVSKMRFEHLYLAGVCFFQTEIGKDRCQIRGHGGNSIYVNVLSALKRLDFEKSQE